VVEELEGVVEPETVVEPEGVVEPEDVVEPPVALDIFAPMIPLLLTGAVSVFFK